MLWVTAFVYLAQESVLDTRSRKGQTGIIPGFDSINWVWFLNLVMLFTCTGSQNTKLLVPESLTLPIPEETLGLPIYFMQFSLWHRWVSEVPLLQESTAVLYSAYQTCLQSCRPLFYSALRFSSLQSGEFQTSFAFSAEGLACSALLCCNHVQEAWRHPRCPCNTDVFPVLNSCISTPAIFHFH